MLKGSHEDSDSSNYSNVASDSDEASDKDEASNREEASRNNSCSDSDSETEEARRGLVNDLLERLDKNKGLDEEEDKPVDPYPL